MVICGDGMTKANKSVSADTNNTIINRKLLDHKSFLEMGQYDVETAH